MWTGCVAERRDMAPDDVAPDAESLPAQAVTFWIHGQEQWTMLTRRALKVNGDTQKKTEAPEEGPGHGVPVDEERPRLVRKVATAFGQT